MSTTVAETNTQRMIGLSDSDTDVSFTSIDYALFLRIDRGLRVFENGTEKGTFGSYSSGDVLSVERTGSTITYLKNGSVFYTSTVASTGDLHVDTSLWSSGATLNDIVIKGDNLTAGPTDFIASSANFEVQTLFIPLIITLDDTALTVGETATVTFTFGEAVTGFDNSDITVEGGTLSAVTSADGGITFTATFTPTADINDTTNLIKVGYDWTYVSSGNAPAVEQVNAAFTTVAPVGVTVTGNSITKTATAIAGLMQAPSRIKSSLQMALCRLR